MIEQILPTIIGTVIGAGVGGAVVARVVSAVTRSQLVDLKARVDRHEEIAKATAEAKAVAAAAGVEINSLGKRVDVHDEMLKRVIYRDTCESCKDGKDERHAEVVRRLESLEDAFRSCFDDLVKTLMGK